MCVLHSPPFAWQALPCAPRSTIPSFSSLPCPLGADHSAEYPGAEPHVLAAYATAAPRLPLRGRARLHPQHFGAPRGRHTHTPCHAPRALGMPGPPSLPYEQQHSPAPLSDAHCANCFNSTPRKRQSACSHVSRSAVNTCTIPYYDLEQYTVSPSAPPASLATP